MKTLTDLGFTAIVRGSRHLATCVSLQCLPRLPLSPFHLHQRKTHQPGHLVVPPLSFNRWCKKLDRALLQKKEYQMHYGVGCLPVSLLTPLGEKSFGLEIRKGRFHVGFLVWDRLKKAHTTMIHVGAMGMQLCRLGRMRKPSADGDNTSKPFHFQDLFCHFFKIITTGVQFVVGGWARFSGDPSASEWALLAPLCMLCRPCTVGQCGILHIDALLLWMQKIDAPTTAPHTTLAFFASYRGA